MRNYDTPATNKEKLMAIFSKKKLISELSDDFGEPGGVANHLKKVASNPFLIFLLKEDIEVCEKTAETWDMLRREWKKEADEIREMYQSGCYACDMGNGEGGCTIPGYCVKYDYD